MAEFVKCLLHYFCAVDNRIKIAPQSVRESGLHSSAGFLYALLWRGGANPAGHSEKYKRHHVVCWKQHVKPWGWPDTSVALATLAPIGVTSGPTFREWTIPASRIRDANNVKSNGIVARLRFQAPRLASRGWLGNSC